MYFYFLAFYKYGLLVKEELWTEWVHANFSPTTTFTLLLQDAQGPSSVNESCASPAGHEVPGLGCELLSIPTSSPWVGMPGPHEGKKTEVTACQHLGRDENLVPEMRKGQPWKKSAWLWLSGQQKTKASNLDFKTGLTQALLHSLIWNSAMGMWRDMLMTAVSGSSLLPVHRANLLLTHPPNTPISHIWWKSCLSPTQSEAATAPVLGWQLHPYPGGLRHYLPSIISRHLAQPCTPSPFSPSPSSDTDSWTGLPLLKLHYFFKE